MILLQLTVVLLWYMPCCHGKTDDMMHHLVLLENLPPKFALNSTPDIIITTNYSGSVVFKESSEFKVLLDISAPTLEEAYAVQSEIVESKGRLLIQVFETTGSSAFITLPWIFIVIGILATIVAASTCLYTGWWYCSKKYLDIQRDYYSHGNVMYRSRNSMHLSSTHAGAESLLLHENDMDHVDDTLREVPEEEETESVSRARVKLSSNPDPVDVGSDTGEEKQFIKNRYHSSAKKIHKDNVRREGRRKRHPSLNDPPSYDTVMGYPNNSSDESGDENTVKKQLEPLIESSHSVDKKSEKSFQNIYQEADISPFKAFGMPRIPVAHSDGELDRRNSGKRLKSTYQTPRFVRGLITPVKGPDYIELGQMSESPNEKEKSESSSKDSVPVEAMVSSEEDNESPYQITADIHSKKSGEDTSSSIVQMGFTAGPPLQQSNPYDSGVYTLERNPMDIPLTSFKNKDSPQRVTPKRERTSSLFIDPEAPHEKDIFDTHYNYDEKYTYPSTSPSQHAPAGRPLRYSIMSDRTLSMYGSSEIFDKNQQKPYRADDVESDLDMEIPPLESDADVLSDASLPLPSPPAFAKVPMKEPRTPSRVFAYDESPPKMSVSSELWGSMGGTFITVAVSPTSTLDDHFVFPPTGQESPSAEPEQPFTPSYLEQGAGATNVGNFPAPPPPKLFRPPQKKIWAPESKSPRHETEYTRSLQRDASLSGEFSRGQRREGPRHLSSDGDYPYARVQRRDGSRHNSGDRNNHSPVQPEQRQQQIEEDRISQRSGSSSGGRGRPLLFPKRLHLTVICTMCILSLVTGVYSKLNPKDTQVHITVYAPKNFLTQNLSVFFNQRKPGYLPDNKYKVHAYDVPEPRLKNYNSTRCEHSHCKQGCDEDTGHCICRQGYRYNSKAKTCHDVNECREGTFRCHEDAGCLNNKGSYRCICSGTFYGDGKSCEECSMPCRDGTFEYLPCGEKQERACRECTKECNTGFFMISQCTKYQNTVCRMCQGKCLAHEFEYQRCTKQQNRICKKRSSLKPPKTSSNLIAEDLLDNAKDGELNMFDIVNRITFKKGSQFYIDVSVKYFQPAALFEPVDHSTQNDLDSFQTNQGVLNNYCPYPVPSHYELFYFTHKDVTYKPESYQGQVYIEPCETYVRHGQFPNPSPTSTGSILCSEPGVVSSVFAVDREFSASKTVWVEQTESCMNTNDACLNCIRSCARPMMIQAGECSINENDNGRSPRLPTCFSCCAERNCTEICQNYHDFRCYTINCQYGSLLEFQLKPVYKPGNSFFCHVRPVANQKLVEIEYTITHFSFQTLMRQSFSIYGDETWQKTGKLKSDDYIVNVAVDSNLDKMPDLIEGSVGQDDVQVGWYKDEGSPVKYSFIAGAYAVVRPTQPFKVTAKSFGEKNCEDEALEHLSVASGSKEPYTVASNLNGEFKGNFTYRITNKTRPYVKIGVPGHISILSSLYARATLKANSLQGNITHNSTHWLLNVTGAVQSCPGVLSVNVSIPEYAMAPLYQYDIYVKCPPQFSLMFALPSGDTPSSHKEFIVRTRDRIKDHQLYLYKPAARIIRTYSEKNNKAMLHSKQAVPPAHFSVPFIASVCGVVALLLFIAAFGIVIKLGQPQEDVLRFRWCHLVLMVFYVTFQFVYAVFVSMTVFALIIIAVNSDTTAFLKNYQQQRSVKIAFYDLELDNMEQHLHLEILRQNVLANQNKDVCENDIQTVIENLNKMSLEMENNIRDRLYRENMKDLLTKHMRELLQKFTDRLNIFKDRYQSYVTYVKKTFEADVQQTYTSISNNENSTWLIGAHYLHLSIKPLRGLVNLQTKPFMEWLGINQNLTQISVDSNIPSPKLPRFDKVFQAGSNTRDFRTSKQNPSNVKTRERTTEIHNFWFHPNNKKDGKGNTTFSRSHEASSQHYEETPRKYEGYWFFFILMAFVDLLWFLHRILKAVGVGSLLLFGYPIFVDIREKTDHTTADGSTKRQSKLFKSGVGKSLKEFFFKISSSIFLPKIIATVFVCLVVYVISVASFHFVNRETFSYLGYYNNMDDMLKLNQAFVNNRIESHAQRINLMEYPTYQELMDLYIQRHLYLHRMVEKQWHTIEEVHSKFYCNYQKSLDPSSDCFEKIPSKFADIPHTACDFQQVQPKLYSRNSSSDSSVAEIQMDAFLTSIRKLISDTCYIVLIYLSVVVIKELLGTVIWLYLKRSGFINLRIIYEADEPPPTKDK